jgi:hypothetical protein
VKVVQEVGKKIPKENADDAGSLRLVKLYVPLLMKKIQ